MKTYNFEIVVTKSTKNGKLTIERNAELRLDKDFTFDRLLKFEADSKKILQEVKKAYKNNDFVAVSLSVANYKETDNNLVTETFDCWTYKGYPDNDEGLHLSPNTQYTNENHDL